MRISSIREVAARAGVSVGTVSRALNGYSDISSKTRSRIQKIANEMNYVPNSIARSLSSKKPPNIGLIVSGLLDAKNLQNTFVTQIMQGVFLYASQNKLEVALYMADSTEQRHRSLTQFCRAHSLSGVIVSGMHMDDPYLTKLVDAEVPTVTIDIPIRGKNAGWVSIDNTLATYELTKCLLKQGHRNITVIDGRIEAAVCSMRLAGVREALAEANIPFPKEQHIYASFDEEIAYQKVRDYLNMNKSTNCTAFLCFSDSMALGVMRAVSEAGYKIPEDFSVVGFDGLPVSAWTTPPMTTVCQDMAQIAFEAASMLHNIIRDEPVAGSYTLPHQILMRGSVSAPRI